MLTIARKEILENLTSYRFAVLTGVLLLLMTVSFVVSCGDYSLRMENYNLLRPKEPNSAKMIIPPTPLSIFAKGLDANMGRLYEETGLGIDVNQNQQSVNRLFALFAVPDMLFTIKIILSLIALLMSFDAITSEKEHGTLKLMLTNGAQKTALLAGKILGRFSLVYVPFALFFLASVIVVSLLPSVQMDRHIFFSLISMILFSAVYVLIFSSLGVLSSTLTHRSPTSFVISLSFWVLLVFVIPQMGATVGTWVADVPPSDRVEMENRLSAIEAIYTRIQAEKNTGEGTEGVRMIERVKDANRQLFESYRPKLNRLIATTRNIVRLSPAGALTFLITDAANTGIYEELRLKDEIRLYVDRNFNRIVGLEKKPVDAFQYRRASLGEVFAQASFTDAVILVLFTIVILGLAIVGLLRYDPR